MIEEIASRGKFALFGYGLRIQSEILVPVERMMKSVLKNVVIKSSFTKQ